ncbi:rho-related GTP-binding protein RhoN isoform X2 [Haemorhous mexicanus]|uniref:rho-related GTP-binding protein RhoN isoform X2 n=1 Tax=Haemorhous mexicanus TaxID=30427 RepID=UPI0028BD9FCC|nr:rho-related GTP-binding protein RhoN isoform X2 [Haemorhous mexicanus]
MEGHLARCKIVVVGDTQCGKTALLHVFAKDCYPESYVPTVFENYTASFEIDKQRTELNMWDTSGSAYYDNVRPLAYPDSDAVLICFDISRPETLDSVLKKWQGETQEFCPNAKIVLVGCKLDMRTDLNTLRELSKQRLIPVTHEQGVQACLQLELTAVGTALSPPTLDCWDILDGINCILESHLESCISHFGSYSCVLQKLERPQGNAPWPPPLFE